MDKNSFIIIHVSYIANQDLYKDYLCAGFKKLGYNNVWVSQYTNSNEADQADVRICIGPHYAYKFCQKMPSDTIYIDRCLWGDDLENVTIGWLDDKGGMIYPTDAPDDRSKPQLQPLRPATGKFMVCEDYGPYSDLYKALVEDEGYGNVTLRPHPATGAKQPPLIEHLEGHELVYGNRTSALVTAAIAGYPIIAMDDRSPAYQVSFTKDVINYGIVGVDDRIQWLNNMSYAQWSGKEIESGEALEYVIDSYG